MDERLSLLRWLVEMGADEAIGAVPNDRFAAPPSVAPAAPVIAPLPAAPPPSPVPRLGEGVISAREAAAKANTLAELRAAVAAFDGCGLKRTATTTVFGEGVEGAPLMVIGEAPGAEEDRQGLPFVGKSGQLLDRMLAAIGYDRRRNAYITNILFWRPPGNRKPTDAETALCLPFVWRHIALAKPRVLLLSGGTPAAALLERKEGITRTRGNWLELKVSGLDAPVPTIATYHPSYLLRSPMFKAEVWRDLLSVQAKLEASE
jgi:uracil-DNA glycosylase